MHPRACMNYLDRAEVKIFSLAEEETALKAIQSLAQHFFCGSLLFPAEVVSWADGSSQSGEEVFKGCCGLAVGSSWQADSKQSCTAGRESNWASGVCVCVFFLFFFQNSTTQMTTS